jgi:hypothetical protein
MADDDPVDHPPPPPPPAKPPLLDYPTPAPPGERETESWSEVVRALGVIFGVIGLLFFLSFGICGVLLRGCG